MMPSSCENVEADHDWKGCPPKEATRKSMDHITSALIASGSCFAAVFGPMAFFGGSRESSIASFP
jgi:HAE1 family hydrophobic/amphiphilic exporter-1